MDLTGPYTFYILSAYGAALLVLAAVWWQASRP